MATTSNQISPGMILSIKDEMYRVESAVKVTVTRGTPFIKTKLKNVKSDELLEKNFKLNQSVKEVSLEERALEFLYAEGKEYLFLDVESLDSIRVAAEIIGDKISFLKESVQIRATLCGDAIYSVELPQFLELMVVKTEEPGSNALVSNAVKMATLETGAKMEVPPFIESGDVIKVDTKSNEYIQRI